MSRGKSLGDGEKTVLVGGLVLGMWLGLSAYVKRVEQRDIEQAKSKNQRGTRQQVAMARVKRARRG